MIEKLVEALEREGYEVDAEARRLVICRSIGTPVIELDGTSCDLTESDLVHIGRAFSAAG